MLVFTAAVMDLLHHGHLNLLRAMRERGDLTLVVLHDARSTLRNKGKLPVEHLDKRTKNLLDTGLVDIVQHTFAQEPIEEFKAIIERFQGKFDLVFVRGDDWEHFPGRGVLDYHRVPIEFIPYTASISSTAAAEEIRESR